MNNNLQIIIEGCIKNETVAQQQLYRLCYPEMIKICYRYGGDADGAGIIFNNAMLRVFKNLVKYTDEGKLLSWIKTIVINCAIDFCKKKNIFKQSVSYISEDEIVLAPEAFDRVSGKEIQQLISTLPNATATVFNLYIYDGFTHKQIAEQLDISEGTSKWHVSEAKKLLKTKLENLSKIELKVNAAG
ncbi:RNA polymerase sigma factor [Ferruginibacter albus]|uniref:RNA polymerase sigma factor n=1 Tax=Ferruginibacter albus TaxID=2875540 RepID=UPI001CC72E03|nr:sigma-70 family RNA polymerase sigma factor [Ferruginibacter albus]UAY52564.1 sigma-70 family RNA polymerase sigma factor [Ferruginibacter albus]